MYTKKLVMRFCSESFVEQDVTDGHLVYPHQGNSRTVLPSGGKGTSAQKLDEMCKDYV